MQKVRLGATDLQVSRLCLGCWQLSPRFWGEVNLKEWELAVLRGIELGFNFLDTADAYGDGYAEECLGDLMAREEIRSKIVLATKFYWNWEEGERHPDTRYQRILKACDASLQRLRTDHIDLYQVHAWDPLTRPEEVAEAASRLVREGKVRWIGVSNFSVEQLRLYRRFFPYATLQPKYNPLHRQPEQDLFPYCQKEGLGTLIYSPLERGVLTGKYDPATRFSDSRDENKWFSPESLTRMKQIAEKLEPMAAAHGVSQAGLILRWVLTHPAVTVAIAGFKTSRHIEGVAKAAEAPLSIEEWHHLARLYN